MTLETDVTTALATVETDFRSFSGKVHLTNVIASVGLVAGTLATDAPPNLKIAGVAVGGFLMAVSTYAKLIHDKGIKAAIIDALGWRASTAVADTTAKAATTA